MDGKLEQYQEILMDVLNQACQYEYTENEECIISPEALSAYESAVALLEQDGLVEKVSSKEKELYRLVWSNLTSR